MMPLVVVSKIAYQRMFRLFDPGVPRTFVEDRSNTVTHDETVHSFFFSFSNDFVIVGVPS